MTITSMINDCTLIRVYQISLKGSGPKNVYLDVENDLQYFGRANAGPVLDILSRAKFDREMINYVNYTMNAFVRMPYSNNWRVRTAEGRRITHGKCLGNKMKHLHHEVKSSEVDNL